MDLNEFKEKALRRFTDEITDLFFQYIENDRELMLDYLSAIGRDSDLDTVNRDLGRAIKDFFDLENLPENKKPKSKLIKTYTRHKKIKKMIRG
jgi:hypothetical protein